MSDTTERYYTVRQVADRLHVPEGMVTRLLRAGTLRGSRTGTAGAWSVTRTALARWLESAQSGEA